jgi:LuxR family transcriptional regulator, maltose regulon positive regulatory protein
VSDPRRAKSFGDHLVVRTKLLPPRVRPELLVRGRLAGTLGQVLERPLTLVRADAGYGKTTALASLREQAPGRLYWYSLGEADADPLVFLLHLIATFRSEHNECGRRALSLLEQEGGAAKHWAGAVDALTNDLFDALDEDAVLVLDDYHLVNRRDVNAITDRLIEHMPPTLHLVISTRQAPALKRLAGRRARGEVIDVSREDLAFTAADVEELFREQHGLVLAAGLADELAAETEGWPIALQLVRQNLEAGSEQGLGQLLRRFPDTLDGLFAYLAEEVLAGQPPELQDFLLQSAVLQRMDAAACNRLLRRHDSEALLSDLEDRSLFVTSLGDGAYRYHHLFHEFLAEQARTGMPERWHRLHRSAAALYRSRGEPEQAIHHAIAAGSFAAAAALLAEVAAPMIQAGRYETLAAWLDQLPESLLEEQPELLRARGDAARLTSRFEPALEAYEAARRRFAALGDRERESRSLEGAARVFLDTVQPTQAEPLLRRALRLVDRTDRGRREQLLLLLAENRANRGELDGAERLQRAVRRAQGDVVTEIDPRIYVRQGRLGQARMLAERELRRDEAECRHGVPRSHRESTAVLAWICAFTGEADEAREYAERALRRGRELQAPIVQVVALSRLGHGWLAGADADPERALAFYRKSLRLAEQLGVARFRVESLLGQVIAFGIEGSLDAAQESAREALAILDATGDEYLSAVVWIALGAAGVLARHPEAPTWLDRGARGARQCGDRYGETTAELWLAYRALCEEDWSIFEAAARRALSAASRYELGCLFTAHPLLGLKKKSQLEELLTAALRRNVEPALARYFLRRVAPEASDLRAGGVASTALISVRALGPFRVWRGDQELPKSAWSRSKALELFQLLLTHEGRPVHREQLQEALWPEAMSEASAVGLRVALSALQRTLEPERPRDAKPRFVRREGQALVLDPAYVRVDANELTALVRDARASESGANGEATLDLYRRALALYGGDYLEERIYEDWAAERRRSLLDLYLRAAGRTAELLFERGTYEEAIELCAAILLRDRCWEQAYALEMRAHYALDNRALALRVYDRCAECLRDELGTEPSRELQALRAEIASL